MSSYPDIWRFRIITAIGDMVLVLDPDRAPHTSHAFAREVDAGAFAGAAFSRIVRRNNDRGHPPIEVIQACQASLVGNNETTPGGAPIHEPTSFSGLRHLDGTVSLPRTDGGGACAQSFFVCIGAQPALDAGGGRTADGLGFAAFGQVVSGMEVAYAIHGSATQKEAEDAFMRGQIAIDPILINQIAREPVTDASDHIATRPVIR